MPILNFSDSEVNARKVDVVINLSATDTDKEIAPAKTGMIPVIVEMQVSFSGAWTAGFEDDANTVLEGPHTFAAGGTYVKQLNQNNVKGTVSLALDFAATRTAGNATGRISYIYIPG